MMSKATTEQMRLGRASAWMAVVAILAALALAGLVAPPTYAASSTFTVNRTGDQPDADTTDPNCDSNATTTGKQCTLRAAIQQANANANPTEVDKIDFNISGTGVKTISPASSLPVITEPVAINGYSQPGTSVNTLAKGTNAKLLIQIDGTNSHTAGIGGLSVAASNTVIKGLVINRFLQTDAIDIVPGSPSDVETNVRIEGNFLGTDPSGTLDKGNRFSGVFLFASSNNTIGGTSLASRNLISGNDAAAVYIEGANPSSGFGSSDDNEVRGNLIGTQKDGIKALGNGSDGGVIVAEDSLDSAAGNSILSNSVFANGGLGIDLSTTSSPDGPTPNDGDDPSTPQVDPDSDTGANGLQNKPSLGSAKTISGTTTIRGTLTSHPDGFYTVQFFSNPSGTDEGRTFIGQKTGLKADGTGKLSFSFQPNTAVAVGQTITATATDEFTGDTSEFSAPRTVASS